MYKKIRKSVAEAIANVDDPEQFKWSKWLKEPQIYLERFPKPRIDVKKVETFKTFTSPTLYQVKKFTLTKFKVSEEVKQVVIKKKKTIKIFFNFPKPYEQKIKIFDSNTSRLLFLVSFFNKENEFSVRTVNDNKESVKSLIPKTISIKLEPIKVKVKTHRAAIKKVDNFKHDCLVNKPELLDHKISMNLSLPPDKTYNVSVLKSEPDKKYLAIAFNKLEKKPSLKNIPVITLDEIKNQLQKSDSKKILAFQVDKIDQKPKQYRVKLTQLEKMQVSLFHLKNLHVKEAKLKLFKLELLDKAEASAQNLCLQHALELKIINPGILSQLIPPEIIEPKRKTTKVKLKKEVTEPQSEKPQAKRDTIKWEEVNSEFKKLLAHQIEGIKLLLTNKTALLCDELGIDKKDQVIYALNAAIKYGIIKNALIVCPDSHIGNRNISEHLNNSDGWENQIFKINPELSIQTIRGNGENKSLEYFEDSRVYVTNYKALLEFTTDASKEYFSKNIECLILDEAQYILNSEIQPEHLFNFPHSKHTWILTSLPPQIIEERLIPRLKSHLVGFEKLDDSLNRTKQALGSDLPSIIRNDFWHELDSDQSQEIENTLLLGRKRIVDLVKGGNPFIIQSNIFTLVHQIKQIGNFSTHKESSPKSELLLDQLESIIASGQKSILFSQYDKQGIQKIERLLKNNQIRYVLYQSGMPLKELENAVHLFKKESKVSVMLAGLTAASIKVKIPDASYLIHFDQWWNPITQWQYEDKTININELNHSMECVNVINYFGNNSVELNIRKTLQKKGLLVKNLIEFLSNETMYSLITNEDWLDILEIEHTRSYKNQIPDVEGLAYSLSETSLEEIGQKTKALFTKLGYKNIILKPDMLHEELTIYGTVNKGLQEIKTAILCLPFKLEDAEPVESFIKEASKNNTRIFVICSDDILKQVSIDPQEKIAYIGQYMFANYLTQFKIS